jgi:hypothetical protein
MLVAVAASLAGCASSSAGEDEYHAGLQLAEKGDVAGAMRALEEGVVSFPSHLRMRFALARLQYESGEKLHLQELNARQGATKLEDDGKKAEAQKFVRDANDLHTKATPFYRSAHDNLKIVATKTGDDTRAGWAYYLLMRCDVFFQDWEPAQDDLEKAIDKGKPVGSQQAQWQDYMRVIKRQVDRRKHNLAS